MTNRPGQTDRSRPIIEPTRGPSSQAAMSEGPDTTKLLISASAGDREAFDLLYERLYDELRQIAHHRLMHAARGETLNTAALVHEAYLKLVDQSRIAFSDRAHFLALASRAMRFILIDHARARSAQKRRGNVDVRPLDGLQIVADDRAADLLALNEALERLAEYDDRLARIVEFRFFGGLSYEEIAAATGYSLPTVKRDWTRARAWLYHAMRD
ncbi:MAG TPA: ECF-type sigma factor [Nannocystis sp.]